MKLKMIPQNDWLLYLNLRYVWQLKYEITGSTQLTIVKRVTKINNQELFKNTKKKRKKNGENWK